MPRPGGVEVDEAAGERRRGDVALGIGVRPGTRSSTQTSGRPATGATRNVSDTSDRSKRIDPAPPSIPSARAKASRRDNAGGGRRPQITHIYCLDGREGMPALRLAPGAATIARRGESPLAASSASVARRSARGGSGSEASSGSIASAASERRRPRTKCSVSLFHGFSQNRFRPLLLEARLPCQQSYRLSGSDNRSLRRFPRSERLRSACPERLGPDRKPMAAAKNACSVRRADSPQEPPGSSRCVSCGAKIEQLGKSARTREEELEWRYQQEGLNVTWPSR